MNIDIVIDMYMIKWVDGFERQRKTRIYANTCTHTPEMDIRGLHWRVLE
jgi:hypothetical protein